MTAHETVLARLDEYVDSLLPAEEVAEVEAHLAGCSACRSEEAALRALLARVAALPDLAPRRDLWSGIAARIGFGAGAGALADAPVPRTSEAVAVAGRDRDRLVAGRSRRWSAPSRSRGTRRRRRTLG